MLEAKLSDSNQKLSLAEEEKLRIQKVRDTTPTTPVPAPHECPAPQDYDSLLRTREDMERQLNEQKAAVEQQQERYREMEQQHSSQLEQIRQAGHDTLAMIVEDCKVSAE